MGLGCLMLHHKLIDVLAWWWKTIIMKWTHRFNFYHIYPKKKKKWAGMEDEWQLTLETVGLKALVKDISS